MTLDLATIADRIAQLVGTVDPAFEEERFDALERSWGEADTAEVRRRLATAKTSFLTATPHGRLQERFALPVVPQQYTVAATDGSMIAPDRHSPARFYLINIGKVRLSYGTQSSAALTNEPDFRFDEHDLYVPDVVHRIPVNETILGVKRACAELHSVADLLDPADCSVALQDGTLILWAIQSLQDAIVNWAVTEYMEAMRVLRERGIPLASYISAPGSADVLNTLRIAICDYPEMGLQIDCNACRARILTENRPPACDILPAVTDRYLFERVAHLEQGERSGLFDSESFILDKYDPDQRVQFFFLNTGREIARIEVPQWVGRDPNLVDRVHAVVYDQAQKGLGYPVVLQEAHEMAVLSMSDRRLVTDAIERQLARHGVVVTQSGKSGSKRGRFV